MKSETTIKNLLRPPLIRIKERYIGRNLCFEQDHASGYESFLALLNEEKYGSDVLDFTLQAINEKWERKFGEPRRWKIDISDFGDSIECPTCEENFIYDSYDTRDSERFNFCPSCGIRLLFSEEEAK